MRISDCSAEVCSSDLLEVGAARAERRAGQGQAAAHYLRHVDLCLRAALERNTDVAAVVGKRSEVARHIVAADHVEHCVDAPALGERLHRLDIILIRIVDREIGAERARGVAFVRARSEEHTSEIKSLMRLSYAVFCL